jgi:hypothetical protein
MAALALVVLLAAAAFHWLMESLLNVLPVLMELQVLPWVALGLGMWLLAGRPADR